MCYGWEGRSLLEVFNIVYLGNDELEPWKQFGNIEVDDGDSVHSLYNVDKDTNLKPIKHRDEIILSGPTNLTISLDETTFIHIDLFSHTYMETIRIDWPQSCRYDREEKRILSKDGTGEIALQLGFLANAAQANIAFQLSTDDNSAAHVYGVVAASTNLIESPSCSSFLFLVKDPDSKIRVQNGQEIPFSRSTVAVPLDSTFFLDVGLYVDDVFVSTTVDFETKVLGSHNIEIPCNGNCRIKVNIAWGFK